MFSVLKTVIFIYFFIFERNQNIMRAIVLTFLSVFLFASCDCNDDDLGQITTDLIAKGTLNGSEGVESQTSVFQNQGNWGDFLDEMESQLHNFTTTTVDFNTRQAIAVVAEVQTSGSEVTILSIEETASNIVVNYEIVLDATTVISQPYHVVSMPKSSKQVVFVEQ